MSKTNSWGVVPSGVGTRSLIETRTKACGGVRTARYSTRLFAYIVSWSGVQVKCEIWISNTEFFGSSAHAFAISELKGGG